MVQTKLPGIHKQMSNSKAGHQLSPAQLPLRKDQSSFVESELFHPQLRREPCLLCPPSLSGLKGPTSSSSSSSSTHLRGHWVPNALSLPSPFLFIFTMFWRNKGCDESLEQGGGGVRSSGHWETAGLFLPAHCSSVKVHGRIRVVVSTALIALERGVRTGRAESCPSPSTSGTCHQKFCLQGWA